MKIVEALKKIYEAMGGSSYTADDVAGGLEQISEVAAAGGGGLTYVGSFEFRIEEDVTVNAGSHEILEAYKIYSEAEQDYVDSLPEHTILVPQTIRGDYNSLAITDWQFYHNMEEDETGCEINVINVTNNACTVKADKFIMRVELYK